MVTARGSPQKDGSGSQEDFTAAVWYGLHAENRVSLFTAFIDRRTGEVTTRIVNRNQNIGV